MSNPVEKELEKLQKQWQKFADTDLPILVWQVPSDAVQLVNAFIKMKEQFDEKNPDLFVHLTVPFSTAKQYAWDLANEFNRLIEEGLEDSAEQEGDTAGWVKPNLKDVKSGFQALFKSCDAFLNTFGDYLESLVLVVAPPAIPSDQEYLQWWQWACTIHRDYQEWQPKLKLITFDHVQTPFLKSVAEEYPQQMLCEIVDVDYKGALNKVLDKADDGSDGAKIRKNLFAMNNAIAENDGKTLTSAKAIALPVAEGNKWFDIAATIVMTSAAGLMNWKNFDLATKEYQAAQGFAKQGMELQIPGCDKLLLQSMLNQSTCLYLNNQYTEAAKSYQKTAEKAQELKDPWMELEAWRMGSFSLERSDQIQPAWTFGKHALTVGKGMTEEQRQQSTLPFVGQALMRMSPNKGVANEVNGAMCDLLGNNWQDSVRQATS